MRQLRIGVFGGTFDPVHQGHIEVALRVHSLLSLDWVDFVPAYCPPHKLDIPTANAWHRFAMLALATNEQEGLFVSTIELDTFQAVYTVETIRRLKQIWKERAEFYFIIGADSFEEITTWKDYERLLNSCHSAVMTRPGYSLKTEHLPETIRRQIVDLRDGFRMEKPEPGYHIYLCGSVSNPASSTAIRQALRERRLVDGIPPVVLHHIEKYQLYRNADETRTTRTNFTRAGISGREPRHRH
ncbi:MAG: nicotinate (nicotinamide) nucleotide adenylyltransferase [Acidobacteria bacterium]|nr:nicotinate (nicotinamide) nucleotide adenylyltransferase [Acidobacteriota bacterium]